ncbi:hypothetical protein [Vibrio sp. B1FLJ16]|uniref:hypothetical protein n=1 Tax=Vibrio sp. B1FLJ16 TaxID=2751178 RepID=UPI0015F6CD70|nr:hypothetical protein [Vibrio sp. B1FLJ16]CAD7800517.1 type II secretion system protein K [Vibrio sp. B1FLJ16]CAE6888781.1 type II secretion system protein K [Vibrio sp. B1FLJ16]
MKFKSNQSGYVTLLVTSVLLLLGLVVALASSKGVFFQIKVAQNELKARQAQWKAEGGLECAFSKAKLLESIPTMVDDCKVSMNLNELSFSPESSSLVTAKIGNTELKKIIEFPSSGPGAIKSTSDLVINGSYTSSPDPSKSLGNNLWECTSVLYFNYFYATSVNTFHPHQLSEVPYEGFPASPAGQEQKCATTHHSWASSVANSKSDYIQSSNMEPFKDVFSVPRSDWFDVMSDNSLFGYVPLSLNSTTFDSANDLPTPIFNTDCAEGIVSNIESGKDLIWVYGGCEIDTDEFANIKTAIDDHLSGSGIILIVQDGIFSTKGTQDFTGMLYHFISPLYVDPVTGVAPDFTGWSSFENDAALDGVISALASDVSMTKERVGYFQHGSFNPLGGFVMDAPGTFAVFNSALSFQYNRDVIEQPMKKLKKVYWKKGSWNDL